MKMTSPSSEFNLFLLLDLDPEAAWSAEDFERRLKEKRREWARSLNYPKKSAAARRNLELVPKLAEIAASELARIEHANAAKKIRSADLAERQRRLDDVIEVLQAKGKIYRREVKELAKLYADVCTEAQIIGCFTVPVSEEAVAAPAAKDLLDRSLAIEIAEKLQELGQESLYDFLGLGFDTHTQITLLRDKAEELYMSAVRNINKDAHNLLTQRLAGHARIQFNTAESKKRYDDTLADMAFDRLRGLVSEIVAISGSGSIDTKQVDLLVARYSQETRSRPETVLEVIREHVRSNRWFVADIRTSNERP